jgi:GNAT superfamily N-acetyltransferase
MILRPILSQADPAWPSFLQLLESSFPPEELESPAEVARQMETGHGHQCLAWEDGDGALRGVVRAMALPVSRIGWIVHIALDPSARGRGQGALLLHKAKEWLRLHCEGLRGIVLEVERVEDARSEEERALREKRVAFFRAQGVTLLTHGYVQPPAREGHPPVPLSLYWLPVGEPRPDPKVVILSFYEEGLGVEAESEWVANAVLSAIPSDTGSATPAGP